MNTWTLVSRLTKDNDFQMTAAGKPVCYNSLAVDEGFGDKKKTFFVDLVVLGQQAEFMSNFAIKGQRVAVTGRCIVEDFERKDGTKGRSVKIIANNIELLDKPGEKQSGIVKSDLADMKMPWDD